jgi:hypothetical protein
MDAPSADGPVSRRSVLRAAGTAAGAGALVGSAGRGAARGQVDGEPPSVRLPRRVRVATRNLGLGARLYGFVDTETRSIDAEAVYDRYRQVRASAPAARMRAMAAGVADDLPAVVGLQEAARIRRGPNDYTGGSEPNAGTAVFDFLALFREGLARELDRYDFDVGYELAAVSDNVDEEFPAEGPDGERFDVRLGDRDAVLVRDDLTVEGTETGTFGLNVTAPLDDGTQVSVERGYALAALELAGAPFTFATTHLAVGSRVVREAQAAELSAALADRESVVLAGDLNTTPDGDRSAAYRRLVDGGLTDAWAATRDEPGPTCCQNPQLRNDGARLGVRIDHVMTGGAATPLRVRRRDIDPESRVTASTPDGEVDLWPSDHAGVVADVRIEPTSRDPLAVLAGLFPG